MRVIVNSIASLAGTAKKITKGVETLINVQTHLTEIISHLSTTVEKGVSQLADQSRYTQQSIKTLTDAVMYMGMYEASAASQSASELNPH